MNRLFIKFGMLLLFVSAFGLNAQDMDNNSEQNFFLRNLNHRVYLGFYSSYFDDDIRLLQTGYDCVLKLIHIKPNFNLLDFGLGFSFLLAFDEVYEWQKDNFGNMRPSHARVTPGFELNWNLRIYIIPIPPIKGRIFIEGLGITLVVYTREFPDIGIAKGSFVNIGSHAGIGMEFSINNFKVYTTLRLFHSSNGKAYEDNPALNAVGILAGVQF